MVTYGSGGGGGGGGGGDLVVMPLSELVVMPLWCRPGWWHCLDEAAREHGCGLEEVIIATLLSSREHWIWQFWPVRE